MKKIFALAMSATVAIYAYPQSGNLCYEYKIQYEHNIQKDSSISLLGRKYFDGKMRLTKEVSLGLEKDSCITYWHYDERGNVLLENTKCASGEQVGVKYFKYKYGKNGNILKERYLQYKPFFQEILTEFGNDSTVKIVYTEKKNYAKGIFNRKDIDVYDSMKRICHSYQITSTGDTVSSVFYLYFPISDTSKVRASILGVRRKYVITYFDNVNKEELIEYYEGGVYNGRAKKGYNNRNKIAFERYFTATLNQMTSEIIYEYDKEGNILKKTSNDVKSGLVIFYVYKEGRIIRQDFIYGNILDHSIVYKYE